MRKYLLYMSFLVCLTSNSFSQDFVWMHGDSISDLIGVYGTKGVANPNNKPGGRQGSITFKDNSGNLWLYAGAGWATTSFGYLNDLWKFNISSNQWTWVAGSNTDGQLPTYGTQGVASPANDPGARVEVQGWTDAQGNIWLFGGYINNGVGFGALNDMWKYDPVTSQWACMRGNSTTNLYGVYGTKGVANALNMPGGRREAITWTDNAGNLWMFGGDGYGQTGTGGHAYLNDLWMFNTTTLEWTWMNGNGLTNQGGSYSPIGVASLTNHPSGRKAGAGFKDSLGDLWLFGGHSHFNTGGFSFGSVNDLWKYKVSTNEWVWLDGDTIAYGYAHYNTQGLYSSQNYPGARNSTAHWQDKFGNFWMFGGNGVTASSYAGKLRDLWKYDMSLAQWVWVKGTTQVNEYGHYGTQGVASPVNLPGARFGCLTWVDNSGDFWMFSGFGYSTSGINGYSNDMWKFDNCLLPPSPVISTNGQTICSGEAFVLNANTIIGNTVWYASNSSSVSIGNSFTTPTLSAGSYTYYAEASSVCSTNPIRTAITLSVNPLPVILSMSSPTVMCVDEFVTLSASGASVYNWSGINTQTIMVSPTVTTTYSVLGTDVNGCSDSSNITVVVNDCIGIEEISKENYKVLIYPNPNQGVFIVQVDNSIDDVEFMLVNILGQNVYHTYIKTGTNAILTDQLHGGLYHYLLLKNRQVIKTGRLVID